MNEIPVVPVAVVVVVAMTVLVGLRRWLKASTTEGTSQLQAVVAGVRAAAMAGAFTVAVFAALGGALSAYGSATGAWRNVPILSGSMSPSLERGDIAVVKPVELDDIAVGDVLVFNAPMSAGIVREGEPVIHRVIEIVDPEGLRDTQAGAVYVRTKGDANDDADRWIVELIGDVWRQDATIRDAGEAFLLIARPNARFGLLIAASILLAATAVSELLEGRRPEPDSDVPPSEPTPETTLEADLVAPVMASSEAGEPVAPPPLHGPETGHDLDVSSDTPELV